MISSNLLRSTSFALSRLSGGSALSVALRSCSKHRARSSRFFLSRTLLSSTSHHNSYHITSIAMGSDKQPEIITAYDKSSFLQPQEQSLPGLDADMSPKAEHTKVSLMHRLSVHLCSDSSLPSPCSPPHHSLPFAERLSRTSLNSLSAGPARESRISRSTLERDFSRARPPSSPVETLASAAPSPSSSLAKVPILPSTTYPRRKRSESHASPIS